jgi:hypothetical protein
VATGFEPYDAPSSDLPPNAPYLDHAAQAEARAAADAEVRGFRPTHPRAKQLSARPSYLGAYRAISVAGTITDLACEERLGALRLAEVLQYRTYEARRLGSSLTGQRASPFE